MNVVCFLTESVNCSFEVVVKYFLVCDKLCIVLLTELGWEATVSTSFRDNEFKTGRWEGKEGGQSVARSGIESNRRSGLVNSPDVSVMRRRIRAPNKSQYRDESFSSSVDSTVGKVERACFRKSRKSADTPNKFAINWIGK